MTSTYTCYEEWYADHIADLDDADKAEAAQRKIEVGAQDAAMWKALYEKRGKEIAKLREERPAVSHVTESERLLRLDFPMSQDIEQAKIHALLAQVEQTKRLADLLESIITDYGSTVPYIRTGKVGGE